MKTPDSNRTVRHFLLLLLFFQGTSGLYGGTALVLDPTGDYLGLPLFFLEGTPFINYLYPGLILLSVLGVFPMAVFHGLWKRQPWSWWGALLTGVALIIWIGVEIIMIGYHADPPLQLIYGVTGILITLLAIRANYFQYGKSFI